MNADIRGLNYFEIFALPESFEIDGEALDRQYRNLQARYHPDRFVTAEERERRLALQQAGILNDAYATLGSPLKRAAYLLVLRGVDPEENNQAHLGEDFLLQQMQLREELENIEATASLESLDGLRDEVRTETSRYLEAFGELYGAGRYRDAKPVYNRLQFLYKLSGEIDRVEEKLLDD